MSTPTMWDKPYQISSDGRISMSWTPDATFRTANTKDWVRWKIADSMFEAEQEIIARHLVDVETATVIRIIIWVNEEVGLVILNLIDGEEFGKMDEFGKGESISGDFDFSPEKLDNWVTEVVCEIRNENGLNK